MTTQKQNNKIKKTRCIICDKEKAITQFYSSNKKEYKLLTYSKAPICKDCCQKMIVDENGQLNRESFISLLEKLDKPFIQNFYEDVALKSKPNVFIKDYISKLNFAKMKDLTFKDSESLEENNNSEINKEQVDTTKTIKKNDFSEEDLKAKQDVIKILGNDPFSGYELSDQKYLYNELIPYLDEDTVDDPYKVSVLLQIVNNNNQIRLTDLAINQLSSNIDLLIKNSEEIKKLTVVKKELGGVNDKLSKENNIALKHRGDSSARNSTLGGMMKNLRDLGFEKAEHDYYDMCKAYGMKVSASISNESIASILNFDDNDMNNMFKMQREELQKLQDKELDYKEQIRVLVKENNELKEKIKELENEN